MKDFWKNMAAAGFGRKVSDNELKEIMTEKRVELSNEENACWEEACENYAKLDRKIAELNEKIEAVVEDRSPDKFDGTDIFWIEKSFAYTPWYENRKPEIIGGRYNQRALRRARLEFQDGKDTECAKVYGVYLKAKLARVEELRIQKENLPTHKEYASKVIAEMLEEHPEAINNEYNYGPQTLCAAFNAAKAKIANKTQERDIER